MSQNTLPETTPLSGTRHPSTKNLTYTSMKPKTFLTVETPSKFVTPVHGHHCHMCWASRAVVLTGGTA